MKDQFKFKCDSCSKTDHSIENCPLILYKPKSSLLITKMISNEWNKRAFIFRNNKKRINTLYLKKFFTKTCSIIKKLNQILIIIYIRLYIP